MGVDEAVAAVAKRQPKTARGRRLMRRREPAVNETPKTSMIIKGNKANSEVSELLLSIHLMRFGRSQNYSRKHDMHPFEDSAPIVTMCNKFQHTLFAFGSTSKKRPSRLILGRLFNEKLLDMQEFGVSNFRPKSKFPRRQSAETIGAQPLIVFQGPGFESSETLKRTKSLLLDFFGAPAGEGSELLLQGVSCAIVCSTFEPEAGHAAEDRESVTFRRYAVSGCEKASGTAPRITLQEIGPRFTLSLDRSQEPVKELWRASIQVPKEIKKKVTKNVKATETGRKRGRIHLGKQNFDQIHTVHHGESKRKKQREAAQAASGAKASGSAGAGDAKVMLEA